VRAEQGALLVSFESPLRMLISTGFLRRTRKLAAMRWP
jgi:hypothetical protein